MRREKEMKRGLKEICGNGCDLLKRNAISIKVSNLFNPCL
jgi:hypothetical protein